MNWTNLFSKIKHAVAPAAGAAIGSIPAIVSDGHVSVKGIVGGVVGAFFGYLFKPARPAIEPPK